jgi:hypothetical protein
MNGTTRAYDLGTLTDEVDVNDLLDGLVDRHGLSFVVATLAAVCEAKAGRIETTWQDRSLAGRWLKAGNRLDVATSVGLDGLT